MKNQTLFVTALLLVSVALTGCGGGSDSPVSVPSPTSQETGRGAVSTAPKTVEGLTFTLSSPQSSYKRSEEIPLTLTVTNNTTETITTYFRNSRVGVLGFYDPSGVFFSYYGGGGWVVDNRIIYAPGQTRQYDVSVPKKDNTYTEDPPAGKYRFASWLDGSTSLSKPYSYNGSIPDFSSELLAIDVVE